MNKYSFETISGDKLFLLANQLFTKPAFKSLDNKITIKNLVSRWGSCSTKGNLNFNCLLMLTPDYVIDYIVVHELCHLREMNHSEKFWAEVEKIMPDSQRAELWLKQNGGNLISRMRG